MYSLMDTDITVVYRAGYKFLLPFSVWVRILERTGREKNVPEEKKYKEHAVYMYIFLKKYGSTSEGRSFTYQEANQWKSL